MKQGSPEWHKLRSVNVTASTVEGLSVKGKDPSGYGTDAVKKAKKIAIARANPTENFPDSADDSPIWKGKAVARGNDLEDAARKLYEITTFRRVRQVGFCECDGYGCSPDGLVGEDGGIEIKCISSSDLYFDALLGKFDDYQDQLQFFLFTTKRKWIDFVVYYPEHKTKPLIIKRIFPDTFRHKMYEEKLVEYNKYIDRLVEEIKAVS